MLKTKCHTILQTLIFSCLFAHAGVAQKYMTYFSLDEALKNPDEVYRLDLSHQNLKEIPASLSKLTKIKRLDLSHNQITKIPAVVFDSLTDLRRLHFEHNRITDLPDALFKLENLKKLYLHHNQLQSLSPEIAHLTKLKRLTAHKNELTEFPVGIMQLTDLEWLDFDDQVFLTNTQDSLNELEVDNWKFITQVPDSIAGAPLSYYLKHPSIDAYSKQFVQGRYPLSLNYAHCPFIDSLFTENDETAPFYTFIYFNLVKDNSNSYTYLDKYLCTFKDQLFLERPCLYIKGLINYRYGYSCVRMLETIDEQEHQSIINRISDNCPELIENRAKLYFKYLNRALPESEEKGILTVRFTKEGKLNYDSEDYSLKGYYTVVLSDSADNMVSSFIWYGLYNEEVFHNIYPGAYTLRVFSKKHFEQRKIEELNKIKDFMKRIDIEESGDWYHAIRNECLIRIDTVIKSIDERVNLKIPLKLLRKATGDSTGQEDSMYEEIEYNIPLIDNEHPRSISVSDCEILSKYNHSSTLYLYLKHVYRPALKRSDIDIKNLKFLEDVKHYLIRQTKLTNDSTYYIPFTLMAAFEVKRHSPDSKSIRILDPRVYDDWEEGETRPPHTGYGAPLPQSPSFYSDFMNKRINVYYENGRIERHTINKYEEIRDACNLHHSYPLNEVEEFSDTKRPVFATFNRIVLEYSKDPIVDQRLELVQECWHSYCDKGLPEKSFARLKGVPQLIFTTDQKDEWMNRYPSRSLYMKLGDGQIILLWNYEVELVECSCI